MEVGLYPAFMHDMAFHVLQISFQNSCHEFKVITILIKYYKWLFQVSALPVFPQFVDSCSCVSLHFCFASYVHTVCTSTPAYWHSAQSFPVECT